MWKAYDRICRPTAILTAELAGFPKRLGDAYLRFHEAVEMRTAFALGLGRPRRRRLAIPQGCPWSNTLLALLMRPLLCKLRGLQVVPRWLADDLEVLAVGRAHASRLAEAQRAIGHHLRAMGSKVATGPGKSVAFASSKAGRRRLRRAAKSPGEEAREVVTHWRDLGAHASSTARMVGVTMTSRMMRAADMAPAMRGLPLGRKTAGKVLAGKYVQMATYGAAVSPVAEKALQRLRGGAVWGHPHLLPHADHRCNGLRAVRR